MTQSMDYTGTIKNKRLKNTGFTEDILRQAHTRPGTRIMAIVELCVDDAHNKHDAPNHVDFTIEQVVPFTADRDEAHLRALTRSNHQQRILNSEDGQLSIETGDDIEPSVEKIIAAREATDADLPHAYIGDTTGDCEICDAPAGNPIHAGFEDPTDEPEEQDDAAAENPAEQPTGHALPVA